MKTLVVAFGKLILFIAAATIVAVSLFLFSI